MSSHSNIGPSSAKRILACPGSVALCAQAPPQPESKYAEEGTLAHAVAEAYVLGKPIPEGATDEMLDGAKVYAGFLEDITLFADKIQLPLQLETRVQASSMHIDAWGTCDAFVVADDVLHVIDYKFGKGVAVSAVNNEQLLYYAAGVIDTFNLKNSIRVELHIVQPRNGGISSWRPEIGDLLEFKANFKTALLSSALNVSDACRWCPASAICLKQKSEILDKFSVQVDEPVKEPPAIEDQTAAQYQVWLDNAYLLESWIAAVRSQAFTSMSRGMVIDGYELTESMGNRKWKEPKRVEEALGKLYPSSVLYESKFRSPAQMEKVIRPEEVAIFTVRELSGKKLTKTDRKAQDLFDVFTEIKE